SPVRLTISDVTGRRVRRLIAWNYLPSGDHQARWDGKDERGRRVSSGVYFATLEADGNVARTRLALLR
ncbi:MAG TPA: FlgD immunoglobulin-like domain containing protein, partial [Candidatus Angelobacter sp.]|nr:FlgD immunoglobulin-like domain containing protein [Candidatus Angelobacter sp.]